MIQLIEKMTPTSHNNTKLTKIPHKQKNKIMMMQENNNNKKIGGRFFPKDKKKLWINSNRVMLKTKTIL